MKYHVNIETMYESKWLVFRNDDGELDVGYLMISENDDLITPFAAWEHLAKLKDLGHNVVFHFKFAAL